MFMFSICKFLVIRLVFTLSMFCLIISNGYCKLKAKYSFLVGYDEGRGNVVFSVVEIVSHYFFIAAIGAFFNVELRY